MTADLAEYRQGDLDPYNECRMMDAERRKMKKRMKKVMVLLMAAALAVPGQSLAGAAKMAVVNAQEQETKAVELQSEYFNMASRYEKVVYSKADHGFYLVKKVILLFKSAEI